jgi:hypothetical protein
MRRAWVLIVLGMSFTVSYGQMISYGVEGGLNLSGAHAVEPGVTFHGSPGVRFSIGGYADLPLKDSMFSIRPKLFFSREAYTPILFGDKTPFALSYINLPLPVIYRSTLGGKKIFFGLGPYFAYALSGKYTTMGRATKIIWGNDPAADDGKRLDIGADALVGYQLERNISLTAKIDWGIKDISAEPSFYKVWTRNFGITCAYSLSDR